MISFSVVLTIMGSDAVRTELARAQPTFEDKFNCTPGQGGAFATYYQTGNNSFESCAALCDADDTCAGFDFTTRNSSHPVAFSLPPYWQKDSCRLFKANNTGTLRLEPDAAEKEELAAAALMTGRGAEGILMHANSASGRQYCSKLTLPTPTLAEKFTCVPGQGHISGSYEETDDNTFEGCAKMCDDDIANKCLAFDFTTADSSHPELLSLTPSFIKHDSCRLYDKKKKPRLGNSWGRSYCVKVATETES